MAVKYFDANLLQDEIHNGPNLNAASVKQGYVIAHQRSMIKKI